MPPLPKKLPKQTKSGLTPNDREYVGVDPGVSGGIACILVDGSVLTTKMPPTPSDVLQWMKTCQSGGAVAVLEKVGGHQGVNHPGSRMFTFGRGYGNLEMALIAADISAEEIPPQKWQKAFGMTRKPNESDTSWKNRLKDKAQKLFPKVKITLATADALLIALYCKRKHEGTL